MHCFGVTLNYLSYFLSFFILLSYFLATFSFFFSIIILFFKELEKINFINLLAFASKLNIMNPFTSTPMANHLRQDFFDKILSKPLDKVKEIGNKLFYISIEPYTCLSCELIVFFSLCI